MTASGPRSTDRLRAFSLLELLAAIALVAILAAIILPVLRSVTNASHNTKCVGNLRAIGGALHAYILDHNGEYPPGRQRPAGERKTPAEALRAYIFFVSSGSQVTDRSQVGPWFCPSDHDRPMELSSRSYVPHSRLGAEDRTPDNDNPQWQPWWSKPSASPRSGQLVYLIDHNLQRVPLSSSGFFSEKSWPLPANASPQPPGPQSDQPVVDFNRHGGHANALFVDGSVRSLTFNDLRGTRWLYVDPTR